ncbi:triosephosphate isomerase, cytosolic-like [Curcuma longa]|uniref:triosephosphate isomerase, cytosolic-like n=1 Tax=Curcuma longa TaxID=136217 RepID=UPI003D9E646B
MARKFFVGGNWKCNGTSEEVQKIVSTLNDGKIESPEAVEVVVSPPFVFLPLVKSSLRPDFHVAAQNCWVKKGGAFTGEISAEMLVNLGIPWVIIGHSERRLLLNESNEFVGDKVAYALSKGLKVIACVGETLEQRESGSTLEVVAAQTKAIAAALPFSDPRIGLHGPLDQLSDTVGNRTSGKDKVDAPEGSWTCDKCNNLNYPFRNMCNRKGCGSEKPSSSSK